jgi:hypothetical protein
MIGLPERMLGNLDDTRNNLIAHALIIFFK